MLEFCCVCGKPLFGEKGKRLIDLCYQVSIISKKILSNGNYCDGSGERVFVCKDCLKASKPVWRQLMRKHRARRKHDQQILW